MPKDFLKGTADSYDVVVIGSGLGGLTAANILARDGLKVLLCEQHYKLGGLATWFKRPGGHIFDISLHGFPYGMVKSCRRYWSNEIADSIVQLHGVRFDNPMFSLTTTFNREDFTKLLTTDFGVELDKVNQFFDAARNMNFYDDQSKTTRELFDEYFPGREDVIRLLMEPITYANGSTLEDPALTYGIVFSNFMSKGVFVFQGGTDKLVKSMEQEMKANGVDVRINCDVEKVHVNAKGVESVVVNGKTIKTKSVVSNSNLRSTIFRLVGEDKFDRGFIDDAKAVRLNNSSTQVYMALHPDDTVPTGNGGPAVLQYCRTISNGLVAQPQHHQSDIFVLLPGYPTGREGTDADRFQHQRQLRRLGEFVKRRIRSEQTGSGEHDVGRTGKIRPQLSANESSMPKPPRPSPFNTIRNMLTARVLEPSLKGWQSVGRYPSRSRDFIMLAAAVLSCPAGWARLIMA